MMKKLIQEMYEEEDWHWWHVGKRKRVLYQIDKYIPYASRVLDYGCGTGKLMMEIYNRQVWGIDKSGLSLAIAKKRGLKRLKKIDGNRIPFSKRTFDLVLALDVLEHGNDEKMLREIWRVLKPGGHLLLNVPAYMWLWSRWDEKLGHKRRYDPKSLTSKLHLNNFKIVEIGFASSVVLPAVIVVRMIKKNSAKYKSDFSEGGKIFNFIGLLIGNIEFWLYKSLGFSLPFGLSIFAVARKE